MYPHSQLAKGDHCGYPIAACRKYTQVRNKKPLIYRNRPKKAVNATGALEASGSHQLEQQPLLGAGN